MSEIERIDAGRKHLEGLLKDRINFYIVFAAVFLLGSLSLSNQMRPWVLGVGTIVSLLIGLAVMRTHLLVGEALNEIIKKDVSHPYTRYQNKVKCPPNANWFLITIPFILTLLFAWLAILSFNQT